MMTCWGRNNESKEIWITSILLSHEKVLHFTSFSGVGDDVTELRDPFLEP